MFESRLPAADSGLSGTKACEVWVPTGSIDTDGLAVWSVVTERFVDRSFTEGQAVAVLATSTKKGKDVTVLEASTVGTAVTGPTVCFGAAEDRDVTDA